MSERARGFSSISLMGTASLVVAVFTIFVLYDAAFEQHRLRLLETVQSRARFIEAVARFDAVYSREFPKGPREATLRQIVDAHERFRGFGRTGEFTLARRQGDRIVFLLSHRHSDVDHPAPVPFHSELAEPMRRALNGLSGTVVGLDYRGEKVLAAYEPISDMELGLVAKIDLSEVRAPFVKAAFAAGCVTLLTVLAAAWGLLRINRPVIRKLETTVRERTLAHEELQSAYGCLQEEVEHRKKAEERIKASLREKEVLLREIHHRVKNNLQLVTSLLRLQAARIKDEKQRDALEVCRSRVQSMSLIHEKLYRSENLEEIDFRGYALDLVQGVSRTHGADGGRVSLAVEADELQLGVSQAIPFGLIINELVSNALKYAFPGDRAGEIRVSLHSVDADLLELTVRDDGIGLPKDVEMETAESLGLRLVKILVEDQLHGEIEVNCEGGTGYRIRMKRVRDREGA